jgi:pilus assembly protein CpaE
MLRGIVISPDDELTVSLSQTLAQLGTVSIVRTLSGYPDAGELGRVVRAVAPQVAFLSVQSMSSVVALIKEFETLAPGIQYIAISRDCDPNVLLDAMRLGIREFISSPFPPAAVQESVERVRQTLAQKPLKINATNDIYSFLPAKAGCGASTLALNVSVALSKAPDTSVILSDFDMNSGMVRFMLKLTNEFSVSDACEHAVNMDESLWPQLVTKLGALDVLHAGKLNPNLRIDGTQIRHLIDFLRRNYQAMIFDLSGNLERYSFEIMNESKKIFLVCTPEIPALHLAREKHAFLRSQDLQDRVCVLVNRCQKRQVISNEQIQQILELPVHTVFSNEYQTVHKALTMGRWIDFNTELGKQIHQFAGSLIEPKIKSGGNTGKHPAAKRKFLDFFSVASFGGAKAS